MTDMSDRILARLRELNAKFIHNFVTNDVASHDAILHPRFICIGSDGERIGRDEYLGRWASGFDPDVIVYWDYRDEHIHLFADLALVRSTNKHVRRHGDREVAGMTTYTDTYLRENGDWLCIQAHLTPVKPEHYPSDDTIVKTYIGGVLQS
jgi:hypothetical protein